MNLACLPPDMGRKGINQRTGLPKKGTAIPECSSADFPLYKALRKRSRNYFETELNGEVWEARAQLSQLEKTFRKEHNCSKEKFYALLQRIRVRWYEQTYYTSERRRTTALKKIEHLPPLERAQKRYYYETIYGDDEQIRTARRVLAVEAGSRPGGLFADLTKARETLETKRAVLQQELNMLIALNERPKEPESEGEKFFHLLAQRFNSTATVDEIVSIYEDALVALTAQMERARRGIAYHEKHHSALAALAISRGIEAVKSMVMIERGRASKDTPIVGLGKFTFITSRRGERSVLEWQQDVLAEMWQVAPSKDILRVLNYEGDLEWLRAYYIGLRYSDAVHKASARLYTLLSKRNEFIAPELRSKAEQKACDSVWNYYVGRCLNYAMHAKSLKLRD